MAPTLRGIVRGNTVIVEDENIEEYDGAEVSITVINFPQNKRKLPVDIRKFVKPRERANYADEYVRELRDNDRF